MISNIENARKKASLEIIVRIANALDISVDRLLSGNLSVCRHRLDDELSGIVSGCSNYERHILLDIAAAARHSLEKNRWMIRTETA